MTSAITLSTTTESFVLFTIIRIEVNRIGLDWALCENANFLMSYHKFFVTAQHFLCASTMAIRISGLFLLITTNDWENTAVNNNTNKQNVEIEKNRILYYSHTVHICIYKAQLSPLSIFTFIWISHYNRLITLLRKRFSFLLPPLARTHNYFIDYVKSFYLCVCVLQ